MASPHWYSKAEAGIGHKIQFSSKPSSFRKYTVSSFPGSKLFQQMQIPSQFMLISSFSSMLSSHQRTKFQFPSKDPYLHLAIFWGSSQLGCHPSGLEDHGISLSLPGLFIWAEDLNVASPHCFPSPFIPSSHSSHSTPSHFPSRHTSSGH